MIALWLIFQKFLGGFFSQVGFTWSRAVRGIYIPFDLQHFPRNLYFREIYLKRPWKTVLRTALSNANSNIYKLQSTSSGAATGWTLPMTNEEINQQIARSTATRRCVRLTVNEWFSPPLWSCLKPEFSLQIKPCYKISHYEEKFVFFFVWMKNERFLGLPKNNLAPPSIRK